MLPMSFFVIAAAYAIPCFHCIFTESSSSDTVVRNPMNNPSAPNPQNANV
jgi:hypothetical protein